MEKFLPLTLDMEEEGLTVPPCFSHEGINYLHIRHGNLYRELNLLICKLLTKVMALSKRNSNAVEIIVFLHRLCGVRVITGYDL